VSLNNRYLDGDDSVVSDLLAELEALAAMYPPHIEKEDKHFFIPVMASFSEEEQQAMLEEENDFDRRFIHELYQDKVAAREKEVGAE
ncbi:MAG: cation-binding protein, partial [Spirochaetota bacterium]|nr:cation-binding protein [Spirochaetota bacterium]